MIVLPMVTAPFIARARPVWITPAFMVADSRELQWILSPPVAAPRAAGIFQVTGISTVTVVGPPGPEST